MDDEHRVLLIQRVDDGTWGLLGVVFRAELAERVGEPSEESVEVHFFGLDEMPEPLFAPDRPVLVDLSAPAQGPFIR